MKIVVIGATGLIGSRLVKLLSQERHEVVAASRTSGVDIITGAGLNEAMSGAQIVIDVSNSSLYEPQAVMEFFQTSTRNLMEAARAAGVRHHVLLSIVGVGRVPGQAYYQAKAAQERLVEASNTPYTIVRSTQFFEFLPAIANATADGHVVKLPKSLLQPIAADDVAILVGEFALADPVNGTVCIAGPERASFKDVISRYLKSVGDQREVVQDAEARYFGGLLEDKSLVPLGLARLGEMTLDDWMGRSYKDT